MGRKLGERTGIPTLRSFVCPDGSAETLDSLRNRVSIQVCKAQSNAVGVARRVPGEMRSAKTADTEVARRLTNKGISVEPRWKPDEKEKTSLWMEIADCLSNSQSRHELRLNAVDQDITILAVHSAYLGNLRIKFPALHHGKNNLGRERVHTSSGIDDTAGDHSLDITGIGFDPS
mmetsp:Transcript_5007/g.10099  ORF Transcript_5007/g.10099 Transcript_5007/m.10099 type:complete len:175 (-) Transcript_5007:1324-1848(-)